MNLFDWSKAPEWAECVVVKSTGKLRTYYWCEAYDYHAKIQNMISGIPFTMSDPTLWRVVEHRPVETINASSGGFHKGGYVKDHNDIFAFIPVEQPSTAPELLNQAAQLLAERGKQYDKSGEERSAAAIVAAFNAITKRDLTPGEGWLFMVLLKAVCFYSNTETPHRDSLEDMIAYAALHAEEHLNDK